MGIIGIGHNADAVDSVKPFAETPFEIITHIHLFGNPRSAMDSAGLENDYFIIGVGPVLNNAADRKR
jgi:hypothetical protein